MVLPPARDLALKLFAILHLVCGCQYVAHGCPLRVGRVTSGGNTGVAYSGEAARGVASLQHLEVEHSAGAFASFASYRSIACNVPHLGSVTAARWGGGSRRSVLGGFFPPARVSERSGSFAAAAARVPQEPAFHAVLVHNATCCPFFAPAPTLRLRRGPDSRRLAGRSPAPRPYRCSDLWRGFTDPKASPAVDTAPPSPRQR